MWVDWLMAAAMMQERQAKRPMGEAPAVAVAKPIEDSEQTLEMRRKFVAKRRSRKSATYARVLRQEAAEAQAASVAQANAARIAREMLPFQIEIRRQDLQRQSKIERNAILNQALNRPRYPYRY
jgi:hypothetical protein